MNNNTIASEADFFGTQRLFIYFFTKRAASIGIGAGA